MSTYTELATKTERERTDLVIIECGCGFHSGFDSTYLEQVGDIQTICPSCQEVHHIFGCDEDGNPH